MHPTRIWMLLKRSIEPEVQGNSRLIGVKTLTGRLTVVLSGAAAVV
jgi:hypothetical protein